MSSDHALEQAKKVAVISLFLSFPLSCLADTYYRCTSLDDSVSYQTNKCGKGQKIEKYKGSFFDPRSMESGALVLQCSPCAPGHSWTWASPTNADAKQTNSQDKTQSLGQQKLATNGTGNSTVERCFATEYLELKDMSLPYLGKQYCNYKRWAKIHSANGNPDLAIVCDDQLLKMLTVFENRGGLPHC